MTGSPAADLDTAAAVLEFARARTAAADRAEAEKLQAAVTWAGMNSVDSLDQAAPRPQTPYYNEVSTAIQLSFTPPSAVDPATTPAATDQFIEEVLRGERLL